MTFAPAGEYVGQVEGSTVSGDSVFALDSWLHGRFWVEGALSPHERTRVPAALDPLPPPQGFRFVQVAQDGALWIAEPGVSGSAARRWTKADPGGTPAAAIDLPVRYTPYEIGESTLPGRWIGESDVHYVRVYAASPTEERRSAPAWIANPPPPSTEPPPTEEEFRAAVRDGIRQMAGAQERYYSRHYSYTDQTDSLEWTRPEGMEVHFAGADARGWTAIFTNPALDRICALAYGFNVPAGWSPGGILCAPARAEPAVAR
jgi:hypothetical protein